jgi:hypothetical protein
MQHETTTPSARAENATLSVELHCGVLTPLQLPWRNEWTWGLHVPCTGCGGSSKGGLQSSILIIVWNVVGRAIVASTYSLRRRHSRQAVCRV